MLLSNSLRILDEHEEETILLISNVVVLPYENGESHVFCSFRSIITRHGLHSHLLSCDIVIQVMKIKLRV